MASLRSADRGARLVTAASNPAPSELVITRPDDWHLHVRDGAGLKSVVPHTAKHYGRAIIMPNLVPPVTTAAQVRQPITHTLAQLWSPRPWCIGLASEFAPWAGASQC